MNLDGVRRLLRQVCMELRSQVVSRYPNAEYSVIGGFYFLRFLCPAIVSPDGFGIVKGTQLLCEMGAP